MFMIFGNNLRIESWIYDIIFYVFFLLILWEGRNLIGKEKTGLFLWGSLIWTLAVENAMVVTGAYDYFSYANYYSLGGKLITGYPGWTCYVLFVPLSISLGWFLLSFPAFIISDRLLPDKNIWLKASVAAVMLISLDLLLDPISVVNEWWRWTMPAYYFRGVSIGNYIGWFFMLFYYAAIYERTVVERGGFRWLERIERIIFRRNTMNMTDMNLWKLRKILYFRTVIYIPIMIITTMVVAGIPTHYWHNRYAPFNNILGREFDKQFPAHLKAQGSPQVVMTSDDIRRINKPRSEVNTSMKINFTKDGIYEYNK